MLRVVSTKPEKDLLPVPVHVGIIMDGNGRWAEDRSLSRISGHKCGRDVAEKIISSAGKMGIKVLTLYAFSTENWNRPKTEVNGLLFLLQDVLLNQIERLKAENICLRIIGDLSPLSQKLKNIIKDAEEATASCGAMILQIAFNYGARQEIVSAVKSIAIAVENGTLSPDVIDEKMIEKHLQTYGIPDPDLIIRTSGEQRLSNFLLFQASYAELRFVDTFWPDFTEQDFEGIVDDYRKRKRRYGRLHA